MKKIITLFVFMLALSFNANAQEDKSARDLGKEDAYALTEYLQISGPIVTDLANLFTEKHEILLIDGISEERKQILSEVIENKLAATLDASQLAKLKADETLYKKLLKN